MTRAIDSGMGQGPWQALTDRLPLGEFRDELLALFAVVIAFTMGRGFATLALKAIARATQRTGSKLDDILVRRLTAPLRWLLPALFLRSLLPVLELSEPNAQFWSHALVLLLVLGAGWVVVTLIGAVEDYTLERFDITNGDNLRARAVTTQVRALRNVARFVVVVLTVGGALTTFESVRALGTGLLASTGVIGIILGFAAQRSIAMIVSGIHLALAQPIRIDDVLIVEGEWGRVEEITLTYVVMKIWDERRLVIPINYFVERPFQNWTRVSSQLLGSVMLYLDYSVPLDELRSEITRLLRASELWDERVGNIQVTDTTERTMQVRALMSASDASKLWDLRCHVREQMVLFIQRRYPHALPTLRATVVDQTDQGPRLQGQRHSA